MNKSIKYPYYVSMTTLSKILNVRRVIIETDFKTYNINKFLIENQNMKANNASTKIILRVIDRLNEYARNNIKISPYHILTKYNKKEKVLKAERQEFLNENIDSDDIFRIWLDEYGMDLNNFKLVIPADEAVNYDEFINSRSVSSSTSDYVSKKISVISNYEQLRDELIKEGLTAEDIAKELKIRFPSISPSRIGKLLPFNPDKEVSQGAYSKRGKKLLGK